MPANANPANQPAGTNVHLCNAEAFLVHAIEAVRQGDTARALENLGWAVVALATANRTERGS